MKLLTIFLLSTIFFSCLKTNQENEDNKVPELKIAYLTDTLTLDKGNYCNLETPLIYNEKLILMVTNWDTKEGWINCYDKNSLELLWTWQEAMEEFGNQAKGFGSISHIYNGILSIAQSNLSYGININTGQTIWKNRKLDSGASMVFGDKEMIATLQIADIKSHSYINHATNSNGIWENTYNHFKEDSLNVSLGTPLPFTWKEKNYIAFRKGKWSSAPPREINNLVLFNLTENKIEWVSDTIPLNHPLSGTPGVQPAFEEGQILLGNDALYSYNVEDGSLEWWKWYGNSFVIGSHLTTNKGVVYANNQDKYLVGLDVHTGEELFKTNTGGSTSKIAIHEDKCYLASVTDLGQNRIMAINRITGEIVNSERAPFRSQNKHWVFDKVVTVDPETGLVYTGDHRQLLIYDFNK